jgi:hypothetical protein
MISNMPAIKLTIKLESEGVERETTIEELDEYLLHSTEWVKKIEQMRDELLEPMPF